MLINKLHTRKELKDVNNKTKEMEAKEKLNEMKARRVHAEMSVQHLRDQK